jgi:RNA polymerase sigma-70 factor (ECF subfamily)
LDSAVEADLVKKAQDGDTSAFGELVLTHQKFAYNVALRALHNPQDAEDLVQEAFMRAWNSLTSFRSEARFRTWLYRIVMNLCYNQLPKLRNDLIALDQARGQIQIRTNDPEMDPVAQLEGKEAILFLQRQIAGLPDRYRIILMLRYQGNCSYAEIADILDLPLGTVKTGIFRARERLKEAIANNKQEWVAL